MQYISHGAYLSTCACVAWTRTPTTRGRPNCFGLDIPPCWNKLLYSNRFRLRGSQVARRLAKCSWRGTASSSLEMGKPQQPDLGSCPMATVAADIHEDWIQDFANWPTDFSRCCKPNSHTSRARGIGRRMRPARNGPLDRWSAVDGPGPGPRPLDYPRSADRG
jgi:hypothetical protein